MGGMDTFDANAAYPLSPMQQGMVFHSLYAPKSGVNVQQIIGTLQHTVNADAFRKAWETTVARHPVLRSSFHWEGLKTPIQEAHAHVEVPFSEEDWSSLSEAEAAPKLDEYLKADRRRGFVLTKAPLMRVALFRKDENDYQFVWTFHHAVLDGRSFANVLKDVFGFYDAVLKKQELQPPPPRPYRDYIDWLAKQDLSESEKFWREQIKGFTSPTPFMVDRIRPAKGGDPVGCGDVSVRLSLGTSEALRELAAKHGLGLGTIFQGAWA